MQTKINQANISAPIVVNQANGTVTATLAKNEATMKAYYEVTKTEAIQYADMKSALGFKDDDQLLSYIRVKAINSFNPKNLIIGIKDWNRWS